MSLIHHVVQTALSSGYLTTHTEERLQRLFQKQCDLTDIEALMRLQQAIAAGEVKRLSQQEYDLYRA
ncbi:hypothetical protein ACN4EK_14305 [Pantanalinema rosaneae CENA516]|uniref:hypothetical protein n=1 Tax=Pantanalinema rosaneae TaxID=1620701 RepID=UPI003D6ECD64